MRVSCQAFRNSLRKDDVSQRNSALEKRREQEASHRKRLRRRGVVCGVSVRDAVHARVMLNHSLEWVASLDHGFDHVPVFGGSSCTETERGQDRTFQVGRALRERSSEISPMRSKSRSR
jgi:hypothetical protein